MAAVARLIIVQCPNCNCNPSATIKNLSFSRHINGDKINFAATADNHIHRRKCRGSFSVTCSASNEPSPSEISSTAQIRSEVLTPFRSVRMFFYLAFIASGSLGGLIAISQLIGALANSSRAAEVPEIIRGIAIDFGALLPRK